MRFLENAFIETIQWRRQTQLSDEGLASALDGLPEKTAAWLAANADKIRAFATRRRFACFVFWGKRRITG